MINNISPTEALEKIKTGAILVDVREQYEIEEVGYDVANKIVASLSEFNDKINELPQNAELIMACKSGGRSMQAGMFLSGKGFKNILNLDGGIMRWEEEGFPVE